MGAVSLREDAERRRDEMLSQLFVAVDTNQVTTVDLGKLKRDVESIVAQSFAPLVEILDIITDPDYELAKEVLALQNRIFVLCDQIGEARNEADQVSKKLKLAAEQIGKLSTENRAMAHKLSDQGPRLRSAKRQNLRPERM